MLLFTILGILPETLVLVLSAKLVPDLFGLFKFSLSFDLLELPDYYLFTSFYLSVFYDLFGFYCLPLSFLRSSLNLSMVLWSSISRFLQQDYSKVRYSSFCLRIGFSSNASSLSYDKPCNIFKLYRFVILFYDRNSFSSLVKLTMFSNVSILLIFKLSSTKILLLIKTFDLADAIIS